jgi:hypothetical protein
MQPCFYFRWLTRRHLHVSARLATDSAKLVEPLSDSPKKPKRTRKKKSKEEGDLGVDPPKKRSRKKKVTGPSLLVESKVKDFLDHVESIKNTLGLEDLERYKPDSQPSPKSPEFEEQYIALRDTLCRAFNRQQLRAFLDLYRFDLPVKYSKEAHVTMIMEKAWSWPSLEKIKKEKIDWTVSSQRSSYLLSPSCWRQIIQSLQTSLWIPDSPFYSWAKVYHCLIRREHFSWAMYRWQ